VIAVLFLPFAPHAENFSDELSIHGFISQGYLKSTDNNYLARTEEGSAEFGEVGVNFTATPLDHLTLGVQIIALDLGTQGNNDVILDWAYGDYRYRDYLGMRIGKFKTSAGLYNLGRDIDMLRIPILLPQSVYFEPTREFSLATQGLGLYGNFHIPELEDFDYELTIGAINLSDSGSGPISALIRNIGNNMAIIIPAYIEEEYGQPAGSISVDYAGTANESLNFGLSKGVALFWNTPLPGLRTGTTFFSVDFSMDAGYLFDVEMPSPFPGVPAVSTTEKVPAHVNANLEKYLVLSGEYTWKRLTLAAEFAQIDIDADLKIENEPPIDYFRRIEGYYGQISYQFTNFFGAATYYSEFYQNANDKDGSSLVASGLASNNFSAWQKDLAISTRFDISSHWLLKLEAHHMDGTASVGDNLNEDETRFWWLFGIKNTFYF